MQAIIMSERTEDRFGGGGDLSRRREDRHQARHAGMWQTAVDFLPSTKAADGDPSGNLNEFTA
jgi:hypothetical protein